MMRSQAEAEAEAESEHLCHAAPTKEQGEISHLHQNSPVYLLMICNLS
jgi:hypothetical protein